MRKSTKIITSGLLAAGVFVGGGLVEAQTNVLEQIKLDASKEVQGAIYEKKEELVSQIDSSATDVIKQAIEPTVAEKKQEYTQKLDNYYEQKLSDIAERPEFDSLETDIDQAAQATFNRYKGEIDDAIADIFK